MTAAKMKAPLVSALITRDHTVSIPVKVFDYEIPVLQEIHGEENVIVQGEKDVEVDAFNAADAYAGLMRKYPQHGEQVRQVFRSPKALAREFGLPFKEGDDKVIKHQQSTVIDHSAPPPLPGDGEHGGDEGGELDDDA